jgi:5'-3' exonuclease
MSEQIQILLDLNALGYSAHHGDKQLTATGIEVQSVLGVLLTIRDIQAQFPLANIIGLWDGKSWRSSVLPTYKERRDVDLATFDVNNMDAATEKRYQAAVKKAASRKAYKDANPLLHEALEHLGIPQVTCFNYEADDLAALFADRYVSQGLPVRLVTSDGDWLQLVRERVVWKSHRAPFTFVSPANFEQKTGFKTPELFVQHKILMGDKGDDVDGIAGFGEKTVADFFKTFPGGFEEFFGVPADFIEGAWRRCAGKKPPKCVNILHEKGENDPALLLNRTLVDLRTKNRPAPSSIKTIRGELNPGALMDLAKRLDLYTLSSDLARFLSAFQGKAA